MNSWEPPAGSAAQAFREFLQGLEGAEFEDQVCAHLSRCIPEFQPIPDPDGGLDGFSHRGEVGYCCYGPEEVHVRTARTAKPLITAIVKKFRADLLRLFEVDGAGHRPNKELEAILPSGIKLRTIYLICSWFRASALIGPLNDHAKELASLSQCRFVASDVGIVVWGPKQLLGCYPADERSAALAIRSDFARRVGERAKATGLPEGQVSHFDRKAEDLTSTANREDVEAWARDAKATWSISLGFEREASDNFPNIHEQWERLKGDVSRTLRRIAVTSSGPPAERLEAGYAQALSILRDGLDGTPAAAVLGQLAQGEVARNIGECTLHFRRRDT